MAHNIKSPSARAALKPRREPYFVNLTKGVYLGYRRAQEGPGTWIARRLEPGTKQYTFRSLGELPDYETAKRQAEVWAGAVDMGVSGKAVTVAQACEAYADHIKLHKSPASARDAEGRFKRLVYGKPIGATHVDKLTTVTLSRWLKGQLPDNGDAETLRKAKDSANRNLNTLKAALNHALKARLVATDAGWKTVTPYPNAGKRRTAFLSQQDRAALLQHCEPSLSVFVRALLLTGLRPGALAKTSVRDFSADQGTLELQDKVGAWTVTLRTDAVRIMREQCRDKLPAAPIFTDPRGNRWNKDSWKKPLKEAVRAAGLRDDVVTYTLRHVAISELIAAGVDSLVVARLSGTSVAMIEKHYGHLKHTQTRAQLDRVAML